MLNKPLYLKAPPLKQGCTPAPGVARVFPRGAWDWDWDKYCRVIESVWLFPVEEQQDRTYNTVHSQSLHHNSQRAQKCCRSHTSSKKFICPSDSSEPEWSSHYSQAELSPSPGNDMGTSSPPLLHKSAPSCQICLKFGCVKHRVHGCKGSGRVTDNRTEEVWEGKSKQMRWGRG